MAVFDGFVNALFQFRGDGVVLESNAPAYLMSGSERRSITSVSATTDQLASLLREIAPPDAAAKLSAGQRGDFLYEAPAGAVRVSFFIDAGMLRIHLTPELQEPEIVMGTPGMPWSAPAKPAPPAAAAAPPPSAPAPAPAARVAQVKLAKAPAPRTNAPRIEEYLLTLVREGCSDLHLSSGNPPFFRKDGDIVRLSGDVLSADRVEALLLEILPARHKEIFGKHHDADFGYEIPGVARFRCNVFMDRKGPGGVFRVIPTTIVSAEDLGLPKSVVDLCSLPKGLVIVTGPTGSGKSTTLAAMIDYVNRRRNAHIITIEDPIEFVHENQKSLVNQREVGEHTDGFKHALRAALREDPDIVLVGEMRDLETVAIAIETAETGHLVFGTLHTNTAASSIDRIIDQYPAGEQAQVRTMLSESLKGVVSQTLCKRKGGGRIAALEVLVVTSSIANLIREGKTFQITSIMQTGKGVGMMTMNDALMDLVKRKIVEPEEAYSKAIARTEFKAALQKMGINVGDAG
ncbi:MAG TPA: type IV pilus twitching motility protein PilT [bacterium]|nr:type IV pilus twitching motility protein PilT [bacterium]